MEAFLVPLTYSVHGKDNYFRIGLLLIGFHFHSRDSPHPIFENMEEAGFPLDEQFVFAWGSIARQVQKDCQESCYCYYQSARSKRR